MSARHWKPAPEDLHKEIVMGPLCPFSAHAIGSRDGLIPRYADSHACVRCIAGLTEGRVALDVHKIHRTWRRRFLEFWSFVEIGEPDQCWPWRGRYHSSGPGSTYFMLTRHWAARPRSNYKAPRIAGWYTWGDYGRLPVRNTCGDTTCCNPLHIKVEGVPHFHYSSRLTHVDLLFDSRKLQEELLAFVELTKERQPGRFRRLRQINQDWIDLRLSLLPDSTSGDESEDQPREHEPDEDLD